MGASSPVVGDPPVVGPERELTEQHESSWASQALATFLSRTGLLALALVLLQLLWRGRAVSGGFFNQDDFLNLHAARDASLDRAYLLEPLAGELSPVGRLFQWLTVHVGTTNWTSVTVFVLVLQTVAALLTWVVVSQLLPDRWLRIPLFVVALFTPLTLPAVFSWSAASIHLPLTVAALVAATALLSHQSQGWSSGPTVAVIALVVALLSSDRAVLLPVVLFFLLAAAREPDALGVRRRLVDTFRSTPWVWLLMAVAVVLRLAHGLLGDDATSLGAPQRASVAGDVVEQYLRQVVWGLAGGPWGGHWTGAVLDPDRGGAFALAVLACALAAIPLLRSARRPRVRVALAGLGVTVLLSLVMAISTNSDLLALGMVTRRCADAALYFVLFAAVAFRSARFPRWMHYVVPRSMVLASLLVAGALLISSAVTTRAVVPYLENKDDRGFVEAMAAGLLGNPATVLLEDPTPEWIIHPWFGDDARVSTVASLLPEQPLLDVPSEHLRKVDAGGHLREVNLLEPVRSLSSGGVCAHKVGTSPSEVPFESETASQRQVLQFDYIVGEDAFLRLQAGGAQFRLALKKGMSRIQVPLQGGFDSATFSLDPAAGDLSACLGLVEVGTPIEAPFRGLQ